MKFMNPRLALPRGQTPTEFFANDTSPPNRPLFGPATETSPTDDDDADDDGNFWNLALGFIAFS